MSEYLKQNWQYVFGAVLLHVLFAGIFGLTMLQLSRDAPQPSLAIQAVIIDSSKLPKPGGAPKKPEVKPPEKVEEKPPEVDQVAEQRKKEEAEQREKEQQQEQERQVQLKREEEQKQQEVQKQERETKEKVEREQEVERKRVADAQAQAEREKVEAKAKAEAAAKAKADTEKKRVAEIERRQKERQAAEEAQSKTARESELRRQLEEEEGRASAVNSGLLNQYAAMIQQQVERNWNRPASARPGLDCEVRVSQTPGGTVLSAQVTQCNGDAAVKQSIEAAVLRASPLPPPPDPRLFERVLIFSFKPAD